MKMRVPVFSLLYKAGRRRVTLELRGEAHAASQLVADALAATEVVSGRVVGRGVKIVCHPSLAQRRGAFSPVFYGLLQDQGAGRRLSGHFQLHPVGRLFVAVWIGMSTLLALALLFAGALRATPESSAIDALPFLLPAGLPFLGLLLAYWLRRQGRADEAVIRQWLYTLEEVQSE